MALYAIGDLHLCLGAPKPMDVFGGAWVGYMDKLREGMKVIGPEDTTVLLGDLSWALDLSAAKADFAWINENSQPYKVNQHQHIPEILQQLQQWDASVKALQFTTTLIPVTRGIMASIYAKPLPGVDEEKLTAAFEECYGKRRFVRLIKNGWPSIKEVSHSNFCDLGWALDPNSHTILVVSVIDNLMKGAAGQAVQNLNHMFELDETLGLPMIPSWP